MITSEEISKIITNIINNNYKITANEISKIIDFKNQQEAVTKERDTLKNMYDDYFKQDKKLRIMTRYFELKAKGITTEAEALEHRELLNKINEMVGIEE